ncbi:hypothetical protein C2I27_04345 [Priestia megaterium]|uniref:hypothetical protein n=1 Tax=Priestia megaterium TaxID=1404 RepID=UPI000D522E89|nr:hypothetical protein [Priestia megaterium]PVC75122.1 hypothetical protein C2I27_04345 [Priestia megaterium]
MELVNEYRKILHTYLEERSHINGCEEFFSTSKAANDLRYRVVPGTLKVARNGDIQVEGKDYYVEGKTLVLNQAPLRQDTVMVHYTGVGLEEFNEWS